MTIRNATVHEISIHDDIFEAFRKDFDEIINQAVKNMREQGLDSAEMSCKITIETDKRMVVAPTETNLNEKREAIVPAFKHKIGCVLKHETKKDGQFSGNLEMVWDDDEGRYILVEIGTAQASMFDQDQPYNNDAEPYPAEGSVSDDTGYLPPPLAALPASDEEEMEDPGDGFPVDDTGDEEPGEAPEDEDSTYEEESSEDEAPEDEEQADDDEAAY